MFSQLPDTEAGSAKPSRITQALATMHLNSEPYHKTAAQSFGETQ